MSKPVIGRPPKDKVEDEFKECIKHHLARNMLECKTIEKVYSKLMGKTNDKLLPDKTIEDYFAGYNQLDLYNRLVTIRNQPGTTVNQKEIANFTSKKDILYLLHHSKMLFREVGQGKQAITTRQLQLLLLFYLHKNQLVTKAVLDWMSGNYGRFTKIMRYGPQNMDSETDGDYQLIELMVRWALELAKHQKLSVAFGQVKQQSELPS